MSATRQITKKVLILFWAVCFTSFLGSVSGAGTIVIKPGQFDHFTLQVPDRIIAGENFVIKVQGYDANKNLITNFSERGKEFRNTISSSCTILPATLNATSFSGGSASISINCKKAEKITFSITESGGTVPIVSKEMVVLPNKLDHFVLQHPAAVTAGTTYDIRIVAKDLFDNTVDDLDIGRNIKINSTGTSTVKMSGSSSFDFRNGMATASFVSEKTGDIVLEIQEVSTGSIGRTKNIAVGPSSLSYFKLQAPRNAVAGEAFDLLIAAYDAFDNLVVNYSATGNGIVINTTGKSKLEPPTLSASDFKSGQAIVKAVYDKAEEVQVIVRERNREQTGKTSEILVENARPELFVVVTPDSAVSGQRFKIKVEAYDRFNNIVKNFNIIGNDVLLSTTGTGTISPVRLLPSDFVSGVAMTDVMYDKAESFLITAKMALDRVPGRVMTKEQDIRKDVPVKKEPAQEVARPPHEIKPVAPPKPPRAEVKQEVKPAVTEAPRKAEPAKTAPEPPKKEVAEKPAPPVRTEKPVPVVPREAPKAPSEPKKAPAEKTAVVAPVEVAKKEEKKIDKPSQPFSVSNISIIEAKNKAMLVINITNPNGHLEYSDEIESRYGKEWLKLKLSPALNRTEKVFKFSSAFIGEVLVEEDKDRQNALNIFVQLLPSGVTFDIARIKNTLIVTLATP